MKDIQVTVICLAYNHADYIRDALEGMVRQQTSFSYEIIVHDDASTDDTASLIRDYHQRYPQLIIPILQDQNQYSQGVSIWQEFIFPRVHGRYIALCEGDDYWTDVHKLQKQFDALEAHPELDVCAHGAQRIWADTGEPNRMIAPSEQEVIFTPEEVIAGGGAFVATASLMYRRTMLDSIPEFQLFFDMDYSLQIRCSLRGGMLYLPDIMCVYRYMAKGSWSERQKKKSTEYSWRSRVVTMLQKLDEYTEHRYHETIESRIVYHEYLMHELKDEYGVMLQPPYRSLVDALPFKERAKVHLKWMFPFLYHLKRRLFGDR